MKWGNRYLIRWVMLLYVQSFYLDGFVNTEIYLDGEGNPTEFNKE